MWIMYLLPLIFQLSIITFSQVAAPKIWSSNELIPDMTIDKHDIEWAIINTYLEGCWQQLKYKKDDKQKYKTKENVFT